MTTQFNQFLPEEVTLSVRLDNKGRLQGDPSYFDVTITGGTSLDGVFDGYCVDTDRRFALNTEFTAQVYSTYHVPDELTGPGKIEYPENFDLVNWIINNYQAGVTEINGEVVTAGDIQRAIWSLIDDRNSTGALGEFSQERADAIAAAAQANGEDFVPGAGQKLAILFTPGPAGDDGLPNQQWLITSVDVDDILPEVGTIGDRVWFDNDGDGIQDDGEAGINGVTVKLIDKVTGEVVATDVTEGDGNYLFEDVTPGDYTVMVHEDTLPAGDFVQTGDPDAELDGMSMVTDFPAGGENLEQDFGYQQLGTIGDRVWFDNDGDGIQDDGEAGINGVTVKLIDKVTGEIVATDVTAGDGNYLFEGVTPGDYTVMVHEDTLPAGDFVQTGDPDA
ncbi:MAG: SdrD B-like domain-containing protein, partial [Leptolyngbyaceae cyanobacterium]